ncbi:Hsp20/alpha crystallin family protein [Zongyangia sp. HA2173]|uniref:Hsp20/alpha crystallin family protein n=1 Tax=Zongyangia sp. HA2173 TaxID=3133035 RepID=UPI00316A8271
MLPSIFGENLFDDFFDDDFMRSMWNRRNPLYGKHAKNLMKTDVRETDTTYEVDIDLPGFKKDEIDVDLKDGYLTISAAKGLDKDEKDKKGKYIRQERYAGALRRSFYVGDIEPKDVSAKYEDGILKISLPKEAQKQLPKTTAIAIE